MDNAKNTMNRFFDINDVNPNLSLLHERFPEIQKEFLDNREKLLFLNFGAESGYYMRNDIAYKGWKVAPIYGNVSDVTAINGYQILSQYSSISEISNGLIKCKPNTQLLPILTETLIECRINKRVGISVVYPGKEIAWHQDHDPEKSGLAIIRGLYGLDVVEEEGKESFIYIKDDQQKNQKVIFKNNEFVFFWGRVTHKVENNLSEPRYMICFDTEIPYEKLNS